MDVTRISMLARRIITQFRRDRRTLALLFVVPMALLGLVGYVVRMERGPIPIGVLNEETSAVPTPWGDISVASLLMDALRESEGFAVVELAREEVEGRIREGEIKAALLFPADFTLTLLRERQVKLDLVLEGSDPADSAAILRNLGQVLMAVSPRLAGPSSGFQAEPIKIEPHYLYGRPEFDALDYFAPVVIPLFAFVLVFLLTCLSFLRERTQGTLERLMATPIGRTEIILGYMLGFGFFAIAQSLVILLFSVHILRIRYIGSLLIVFAVEAILVVGAVNLGIFLSTFAKTEFQVVQFMPLVIVPPVLLSGTFWAVEEMPRLLRGIAYLLPLTYANWALREVMIKGLGWGEIWLELVALAAFAVAMVLLGSLTLRREAV